MKTEEQVTGVLLKPLDTLFFRDGRPFQESSRVESAVLPFPQTIAGALRTALLASTGFNFRKFADKRRSRSDPTNVHEILRDCGAKSDHIQARFRGPWLALTNGTEIQPLLPVPQTLTADASEDDHAPTNWQTLRPRNPGGIPLPGWVPSQPGIWPLWRQNIVADVERPSGFLTLRGIQSFLAAISCGSETPTRLETEFFKPDSLYAHDSRIGIAVDSEKLTAADGMLYGINLLSLPDQVGRRKGVADDPYVGWKIGLYVEIIGPTDVRQHLHDQPIPLGGEGRHAVLTLIDQLPRWPILSKASKSVIYLATPGLFTLNGKSHWLPNALSNDRIKLRGAASDKAIPISGWDIARRGPKATRFAVPAGAVYFVEGQTEFKHGSLCDDEEDVAQGWGFALQGEWQ